MCINKDRERLISRPDQQPRACLSLCLSLMVCVSLCVVLVVVVALCLLLEVAGSGW